MEHATTADPWEPLLVSGFWLLIALILAGLAADLVLRRMAERRNPELGARLHTMGLRAYQRFLAGRDPDVPVEPDLDFWRRATYGLRWVATLFGWLLLTAWVVWKLAVGTPIQ